MGEPKLSHLRALWACFGCMSSIYLITIGGVCPPYLITIVGDLNSTLENHPGAIPNGIFISLLYNRQGYCVRTFSYSYSLNSNCSHEMIKTELTKSNVRRAFNFKRDYLGILNPKSLFSTQAPWPFMVNYLHICHLTSRHKTVWYPLSRALLTLAGQIRYWHSQDTVKSSGHLRKVPK